MIERPILSKSATSFVGFGVGDTIAQLTGSSDHPLDGARTLRMAAFGACVTGPAGHVWYKLLDAVILSKSTRAGMCGRAV